MSKGILIAALLAAPVALTGCASQETDSQHAAPAPAQTAKNTSVAASSAAPQEIRFKTADGWTIVGDLYAPSGAAKGAVVLLHQRGGSAKDWQPLCLALREAGITALAIDQRGAGRSTQGPGPTGNDAPWPTSGDIAAAVTKLADRGPVGLAGASYGANNAIIYAAAHPNQVRAVALFSPGADYHGLDALLPARAYRGAVILYHARDDRIAGDGPQQINTSLTGPDHAIHFLEGGGHGTALLDQTVTGETVAFFRRVLK